MPAGFPNRIWNTTWIQPGNSVQDVVIADTSALNYLILMAPVVLLLMDEAKGRAA
ncbi:MAG: hypothetical protein ACR2NN_02190 [Bryobacteraceae bacterium]